MTKNYIKNKDEFELIIEFNYEDKLESVKYIKYKNFIYKNKFADENTAIYFAISQFIFDFIVFDYNEEVEEYRELKDLFDRVIERERKRTVERRKENK